MKKYLLFLLLIPQLLFAAPNADIVFVTQVPNPDDFVTVNSTFGNHMAGIDQIRRGGDLYIRYKDGTLKNLTAAAGFGNVGFQGANSIAVRDPAVHWNGDKVIFSMVIGSAASQYQVNSYYWQIYEITGLGKNQTPVVTKVSNQPNDFNNVMPIYGSDDQIIFVSDRPRNGERHLYPQRDEYESAPTNTGIWKLNPATGSLFIMDHAPSGDFHPTLDSFGRILFTRWDHLQRDQQAGGLTDYGAFNYSSEASNATRINSQHEFFPEARNEAERNADGTSNLNLHRFNHFFPWMINQDGSEMETINHLGRHELHDYFPESFNDDPELEDFSGQSESRFNLSPIENFFQIKEDPTQPGRYYGVDCPEFSTHASGQIVSFEAPPSKNPDLISVNYVTHRSTASYTDTPSVDHSGLYRDPAKLTDGSLVSAHTSETREDDNIGTGNAPASRYDYRIKSLALSGGYFKPAEVLTAGIAKNISWYSPDVMTTFSGNLWELQPVELVARAKPPMTQTILPAIEGQVFADENVALEEFRNYLIDQELALIIVRNVTTRDKGDEQQPYNLKVPNGVQTVANSGKSYEVSEMQIFQGDQIRGYANNDEPTAGRRVLAQPMRDSNLANLIGEQTGSVKISADGSVAAIVPASRALSWHLTDQDNKSVIKERYWLTFRAGEIRVCGSCHGVNQLDQQGNPPPENSPEALRELLSRWKGIPYTPLARYQVSAHSKSKKKIIGNKFRAGHRAFLNILPLNSSSHNTELSYRVTSGEKPCAKTRNINVAEEVKSFGKLIPEITGRYPIKYQFFLGERKVGEIDLVLKGLRGAKESHRRICKILP